MWYWFALGGAFVLAVSDVFTKKLLRKEHTLEFLSTRSWATLVMALLLLPFVPRVPSVSMLLLVYLVSLSVSVALWLEMKAFRHMDISALEPLYNLSPLFLVIFAFFFLGEKLSWHQAFGVLLLIVGAYVLESGGSKSPLKILFSSKPIHLFLAALIIYSAESTFERYLMVNWLDAFTYLYFVWLFISVNLALVGFYFSGVGDVKRDMKKYGWLTFLVAFLHVFSIYLYLRSISLAAVSLAIPIRRLSTLFATFLGGRMFHDKNMSNRILACCILVVGAVLIIL